MYIGSIADELMVEGNVFLRNQAKLLGGAISLGVNEVPAEFG